MFGHYTTGPAGVPVAEHSTGPRAVQLGALDLSWPMRSAAVQA
jgi:hypothetical protein